MHVTDMNYMDNYLLCVKNRIVVLSTCVMKSIHHNTLTKTMHLTDITDMDNDLFVCKPE